MLSRLASLLLLASSVLAATSLEEVAAAYGHATSGIIETVDVSGDGKLLKHVLVAGSGEAAQKGQTVHAHYDGKLAATGTQFDSSRKRGQPFTFQLGQGRVIKGWDLGFAGMRVGEKAILQIDSTLGYGSRGAGGSIGPNAELLFEVRAASDSGNERLLRPGPHHTSCIALHPPVGGIAGGAAQGQLSGQSLEARVPIRLACHSSNLKKLLHDTPRKKRLRFK